MDRTLFAFIWKYSKRDQMVLLAVTLLTFPLLYATLELPKRIINDAISAAEPVVALLGMDFSQIEYLMILCGGFLLAVLAHGLLKMRLNTMKGILAERMLRRFRFQLLNRMMRFPKPYFRTTSQGELVSMITSEAEPMGGLMGDALSQPVFQAGQMATILFFLFAQSVWFGLAAVALIPLQAWLIPRLQRQINLLNKSRIQEVRKLAAEIGESAAGVSDLRVNGGLRWRAAMFGDRLGRLFGIRFEIYQKKFFMKFLNNFINQLTPFFFYSVGGILAIQGQITVGALVAALAAYKDLSSPWKELLAYYNQTQDMSLRWEVVTERFAPEALVSDDLFEGEPAEMPHLDGDIVLHRVTVKDESGHEILEDLDLTIPSGSRVAIKIASPITSQALANLLTREVIPARGEVTIGGQPLNAFHQGVIAQRIGLANSNPYIFEGTIGENLMMPFLRGPQVGDDVTDQVARWMRDAERSGNPPDPMSVPWLDPSIADLEDEDAIKAWWFELVRAMGIDEFMMRRTLKTVLKPGMQPDLQQAIVDLRPEIARRLKDAGLDDIVFRFDPDTFNPVSPLASNLLYALPTRPLGQEVLAGEGKFVRLMREEGIAEEALDLSTSVIDSLDATFGTDGTDHPLFRMLNLEEELYFKLSKISAKRRMGGNDALSLYETGLLLTVPFAFSAEQIGPAFQDSFKDRVLAARRRSADRLLAELDGMFRRIDETEYIPVMTVLGNAIFGRISQMAGAREEKVVQLVCDVLDEHGMRRQLAQAIYDVETGIGAENLPPVFRERIAFSRAAIKKPDILVSCNALASHDAESRSRTRSQLRELMPRATKIFIEKEFNDPANYDLFVEIVDGRIDGVQLQDMDDGDSSDLARKLKAIAKAPLFADLDRRNQRLLAFSAQWFKVKSGCRVFSAGEPPDAAYLCVKGRAALYFPDRTMRAEAITEVEPGRVIGDHSIIVNEPRNLDLEALEDTVFLRIGAVELLSVIESDVAVATSLLRTVSGHLTSTAMALRDMGEEIHHLRENEKV